MLKSHRPKAALRNEEQSLVRRARRSDLRALLQLIGEYYRYDRIDFDAERIEPALRRLLGDESLGCVWVVECDASLAGYVVLTFNYDLEFGGLEGIVTDLFLRAEYRGHGLGALAMDAVSNYCRARGIAAIELQVTDKNKAARSFYRTLGFRKLSRVVMAKDL